MDEFQVRLRIKHFNKIVPIEGGRVLRSQEIRETFLTDARSAVDQFDTLAGYAFVCWNDKGETITSVSSADFGPYETRDIPRTVAHEVRRALGDDTDDETEDDETGDDEV